jgi:HEAT repeat protein
MIAFRIAVLLTLVLAFSCTQRSSKPVSQIQTPVARSQSPAPEPKPGGTAVPAAPQSQPPQAEARRDVKPAPQPAPLPEPEAPFVPPADYAKFLDELLPGMGAADPPSREKAQRELDRACCDASAPGNENRRAELCQAISARLESQPDRLIRFYLLRQLERIGDEDCVVALRWTLDEDDPQIRDAARRALQNIPVAAAGTALEKALEAADEPAWRVALINALAARGHKRAMRAIAPFATAEDTEVALAAIAALGRLGGIEGSQALQNIMQGADPVRSVAAADALIRAMDGVAAAGESRRVLPLYAKVASDPKLPAHTRGAALRGMVKADPTIAKPYVLRALADRSVPEIRPIAARLMADIPDEDIIFTISMNMPTYTVELQTILLNVLAERGDPRGKLAVTAAIDSPNQTVRLAAFKALQKLGDAADIPRVARAAAQSEGAVRDAARVTLVRLPGSSTDLALMTELDSQTEPDIQAEIVRALAGRGIKLAVPRLLALINEAGPVVRAAVYEALGQLASADTLPQLIGFLVADTDEDAAKAAENSLVQLAQREDDRDRRAAPVVAALQPASGVAAVRLVTVLGRLQGPAALTALRTALKSADEAVADAAVRALSNWEDAAVLDDLLQYAASENETRHALALRGYIRLIRLPNDRPSERTLEMLKQAMQLARVPDEQKLVLAALADVRDVAALEQAQSYLNVAGLHDEAAAATVSVARRITPFCPAAAKAALEQVLAAGAPESAVTQAREALKSIQDHAGTIGVWVYSGPYSAEGKGFADVFASEFDPEAGSQPGVTWKALTATRSDDPWIFDLTQIEKRSNCCVYVRTGVWSDKERAARLELGSDDAVKAWLNGQLVHSNQASRAVTPGEDKVEIRLQRGWNTLLLKVVQSGGSWGFACAVCDAAGEPLPEVKFDPNQPPRP